MFPFQDLAPDPDQDQNQNQGQDLDQDSDPDPDQDQDPDPDQDPDTAQDQDQDPALDLVLDLSRVFLIICLLSKKKILYLLPSMLHQYAILLSKD
jgi:hypothetical protein